MTSDSRDNLFGAGQTRVRLSVFTLVVTLLVVSTSAVAIITQIIWPTEQFVIQTATVLLSVASSLLASYLFLIASLTIFGEPLQQYIAETRSLMREISALHESASLTGLTQMFPRRAGNQEVFFELLSGQWSNLDILAVKVEFLMRDPRFAEYLLDGCRRGATVRLLLAHPSDQALAERAAAEKQPQLIEKARISVESAREAVEACKNLPDAKVIPELRGHLELHYVTIMRVDNEMLYYSRMPTQKGADCPVYRVKRVPNGPFEAYSRFFEVLWRRYETAGLT